MYRKLITEAEKLFDIRNRLTSLKEMKTQSM